MGEIRRDRRGRLTFVYHDGWRSLDTAFPLSLSMPLVVGEHEHARIEPWLWGLLPDSEAILARWGRRFHVSARNAFALLGAVGEDCPGAVQLVRPERVDEILRDDDQQVEWLTDADVAERLRILRHDRAAWRVPGDTGQFSLAGAQPKTALLFDGQRWGVPYGRTPTTHILKPPIDGLDGHAENEHLCLALARKLGLPAASSEVRRFEDEAAIVVKRYDRARLDGSIRRLHQEDMCQVLGLPPTKKYQNEGGPGCTELGEAIRTHSGEPGDDARTFARAIMLNWIIGGTDAHAKNFSMLIGAGGRAALRTALRHRKHAALRIRSEKTEDGDQDRREIPARRDRFTPLGEVRDRLAHPARRGPGHGKEHGGDADLGVCRNARGGPLQWA